MTARHRIGIFGGTFNPVHNGHIRLTEHYRKALHLDRLIVIPTNIPPHKTVQNMASAADRYEMLKLAFSPYQDVCVSDMELLAGGKSYTINTLTQLRLQYPQDELFLIIGGDMFLCFDAWREYRKILSMCRVCTAPREQGELEALLSYQKKIDPEEKCTLVLDAPVFVLSSSLIRHQVRDGEDISGLVPLKVERYILEKGLYQS